MTRTLALLAAAAALLTACQTTPPEPAWAPREGQNLAADRAECARQAGEANIQSLYGNDQAGAAAAAAAWIDQDDLRGGGAERLYAAVRDGCMAKKGWTAAK